MRDALFPNNLQILMIKKPMIIVTGPARSGKSEWAEMLAMQSGKQVIYVATAKIDVNDVEWQERITKHQKRRPAEWLTLSVPEDIITTIRESETDSCLLIDSLGTWVANWLDRDEEIWENIVLSLLNTIQEIDRKELIFVAEETGWGVVPAYPVGRLFRDRLGNLVRYLGAIANAVYLVTGGHVINLTMLGSPLPLPPKFIIVGNREQPTDNREEKI